MTIGGALSDLNNLLNADDIPCYYKPSIKAVMDTITPQKLIKGEWLRMSNLSEQEDDRYKCSRCGNVIHYKDKMDLYTFNSWCGRCGSDNGRHVNYDVEE